MFHHSSSSAQTKSNLYNVSRNFTAPLPPQILFLRPYLSFLVLADTILLHDLETTIQQPDILDHLRRDARTCCLAIRPPPTANPESLTAFLHFPVHGLALWVPLRLNAMWTTLGDLYPFNGRWICRTFRGTTWQCVRQDTMRRYIINKYRVLLTRAREGTVIWVPHGHPTDFTRSPDVYESIASYLASCGIQEI